MRTPNTLSVLTLALLSSTALAAVNEPNNLSVPITPGGGYTETTLQSYFTNAGEAINAVADAHAAPDTFLPLCDFSAKFVLNQAGSHFGLAWYNVVAGASTPPTGTALHTLIAANSPLGTLVTSNGIKTDPAYLGGAIGFALIGGETHYSQAKFDKNCSGCTTPGPWITALAYKSTVTANAYYVAFEDGGTTASNWSNDGDFNDDVFLVTGLACQGGGVSCQTGLKGVCATGVTECDGTGTLVCKPVIAAGAETCNGLDDDCNDKIDDGATCDPGTMCIRGQCVPPCGTAEFPCSGNLVCDPATQACVDPACVGKACSEGQVCVAGVCQGGCTGVVCPHGQECRVGRCVDPCAGVTCTGNNVCVNGACVPSCECLPCSAGLACAPTGQCDDPGCIAIDAGCGAGLYCATGGMCIDACAGVTCPSGQGCQMGTCVDLPPTMTLPPTDDAGVGDGTNGGGGGGSGDGTNGGTGGDGTGNGNGPGASSSGCTCQMGGHGADLPGALLILIVGAWLVTRRFARR